MEKEKTNIALIFAGLPVSEEERFRVGKEIEKVGGLTFGKIERSEDGWVAQCKEIPSIIAGNTNPKPTNTEIESEIRQAILAAFGVDVKMEEQQIKSPFKFEYESQTNQRRINA